MKYLQTFRLHPTPEQADKIRRRFVLAGYAYNWGLQETERVWETEHRHLSMFDVKDLYRHHVNFELRRPCGSEENEALVHLDDAYTKFKEHNANMPRRKEPEDMTSCTVLASSAVPDYERGTVRLPHVGQVRCTLYQQVQSNATTATIKEVRRGEFRVIYLADMLEQPRIEGTPEVVGIDLGLKTFATLSDGTKIDFPEHIFGRHATRHEQHLQRMQIKCKKGSRRWQRAKDKLARFYEHRNNQRKDFHCQTAARLTKQYQAVAVEDLYVEEMMTDRPSTRNRDFSRYGLRQFVRRLESRCLRTGTQFLQIGRYEPTSKLCHVCGYKRPSLSVKTREWTCPKCGTIHDRDVNAAINIKMLGQQIQTHPDDSGGVLDVERAKWSRREASKAGVEKRKANRLARSSQEEKEHVITRLARNPNQRELTASDFLKVVGPIIAPKKVSMITDVSVKQLGSVRRSLSLEWRREMMAEKCERLRLQLIEVLRNNQPSVVRNRPEEYVRKFNDVLREWLNVKKISATESGLTAPVTVSNSIHWHLYIDKLIKNLESISIKV